MRKKTNRFHVFVTCAALGVAADQSAAAGSSKPDVLFIAIDDMNDWTTLFDDSNPIQTPNLKRLAERGMFFSQAYCASAGCNPSRAAIMTGLRPTTSGVYGNGDAWRRILPDAVTLSQYFEREGGYATMGAGKIFHHGKPGNDDPENPSFQQFFKLLPTRAPRKNYNGYTEGRLSRTTFDWGEHDRKIVDVDTVEWIEARMDEERTKPCFYAAGIFNPHLPFYAPPDTFKRYPLKKTEMPPMPRDDFDDIPAMGRQLVQPEYFIYENTTQKEPGGPGSLQKLVQSYQAAADYADQMVGRLIDKLDASGRADDTIIVLWSDHGYHLGDKECCVKFTLWEKATHVPFIIVAPGVTKPGSRCSRPVGLVDIYPTLLDLCGLPAKSDNDGRSLLPLMRDPVREWPPAIMTQGRGNHAVRSDRWRYIRYIDGTEELYDQPNDPWNLTNLVADLQYADVIAGHKEWLPKSETPVVRFGPAQGAPDNVASVAPGFTVGYRDILIADFEGESYGDWKVTGDAFGSRPAVANFDPPNRVACHIGSGLVNSYRGMDASTGTLTSPAFKIERSHINFLLCAGNHAGTTCINLRIDGQVVRTACGPGKKNAKKQEELSWRSWNVAEFAGQQAVIEIVDNYRGGWGHIDVDHIVQSDRAPVL